MLLSIGLRGIFIAVFILFSFVHADSSLGAEKNAATKTNSDHKISKNRSVQKNIAAKNATENTIIKNKAITTKQLNQKNNTVVSLNLCSDQLALELLPKARIESLSFLVSDRQYSPNWQMATGIVLNYAKFEELFIFQSKHFMVSEATPSNIKNVLHKLNKNIIEVPHFSSINELQNSLRDLGVTLNVQQQAQQLSDELAVITRVQPPENFLSLLMLTAGAYAVGAKSLEHILFEKAGFVNLAPRAGVEYFGAISLERIIMLQPDVIIINDSTADKSSAGQRLLQHPAFSKALSHTWVVNIDSAYSACSPRAIVERFKLLRSIYARYPH